MQKSPFRKSLSERLDVADLKYDIKRLSAELYYHKSKSSIFEQMINVQQTDLDEVIGTHLELPKEEIYK